MAVFNAAKKEIDIKIVYYGPALGGKTSNVQCIHNKLDPDQRGDIMSLATKDDRTLFFDFMPIELGDVKGFKTRFHIYTVPGQVYYALTRRAVLTGVDGVVFVADSQQGKGDENLESLKDLDENLKFNKKDLAGLPFVMQYNKRDLDNIEPVDVLEASLNTEAVPSFEASAVDGFGVIETLTAVCKQVLQQMNQSSTGRKRPAAKPSIVPRKDKALDEPIVKIISDEPDADDAPVTEPEQAEVGISGDLSLDEPPGFDEPLSEMSAEQASQEEPTEQAAGELESEEIPFGDPLSLDAVSESVGTEPELNLDSSFETAECDETAAPMIFDQDPVPLDDQLAALALEDDAAGFDTTVSEIPLAVPSIDIEEQAGGGLKIIACGQPQMVSETAVKIPIIFKIDSLDKECKVNVQVSLDDFKVKEP